MIFDLELVLKSPLLVGGRKADSTFIESLDYIPGRVIRASVARLIVSSCPVSDCDATDDRRYWVVYADTSECVSCQWKEWCQHFGEIVFNDARPFGADVFPQTTLGCKDHEDHPRFDGLPMLLRGILMGEAEHPRCPECGSRVQRCQGFHLSGKRVALRRRLLTRVGINPQRGVAEDQLLYTLRVISEQIGTVQSGWKPVSMQGTIRVPDGFQSLMALSDHDLHLGAKTTSGLGRAKVSLKPVSEPQEDLVDHIRRFTAHVVGDDLIEPVYVPVLLVSDGLLGLESSFDGDPCRTSTEVFCQVLGERIWPQGSAFGAECILVRAQHRLTGGYATWKPWGDWRLPVQLLTEKGAVFVFRLSALTEAAIDDLIMVQNQGIGHRTLDGYGQVKVADEFTLMGKGR